MNESIQNGTSSEKGTRIAEIIKKYTEEHGDAMSKLSAGEQKLLAEFIDGSDDEEQMTAFLTFSKLIGGDPTLLIKDIDSDNDGEADVRDWERLQEALKREGLLQSDRKE